MIPRFLSISLLLFFLTACVVRKSIPVNNTVPKSYVSNAQEGLIYRSTFNFRKHHFSGLIVIKAEIEDIRILFMSELGPTIMDLRLTRSDMEAVKIVEWLNRGAFLTQFEHDLRLLLLANLYFHGELKQKNDKEQLARFKVKGKKKMTISCNENLSNRVVTAERKGMLFDKVSVVFDYTDNGNIPVTMVLEHKLLNINLKLMRLN